MDKNTNLNAIIFKDDLCVHRLPSRQMPQVNRNSGMWIFNWAQDFSSAGLPDDGMRYFEFYCIAHLLRGRGVYWTGNNPEPVEVEPGMCILMSPGTRHYYGAIPGGVFVEDTVNFWGPAADLLHKSGLFRDGVYRIGSVPVLRQVMELAADPSEYSQLNAEFALREILQNIYNDRFNRGSRDEADHGIAPLLEAVKKHPERPWTVISMAEFCNMSVNGFRECFKKRTGVLPKIYLDRYRMSLASSLLIGSDLSAKEIADRCGYPDPFHFSRRFKNITGLAPADYRRRFSKNN